MNSIGTSDRPSSSRSFCGTTTRRAVLILAALGTAIAFSSGAADAKGGSGISVTTTAAATGTIVSGVITLTNTSSRAETVTAITDSLEVRFPSGSITPPLPAGSGSGWYTVATASLPSQGSIAANSSMNVAYNIATCGPGVASFNGATQMRVAVTVSATAVSSTRSADFPLPEKCPVCGNGKVENGEQCDQGYNGGACCTPACQFRANGTSCNDGDACTRTDQCQAGICAASNPVSCVASDQCHVAGTCIPATGLCSNPAKANGSACNDQNACTRTDTCQSGICSGSNAVMCVAADQCHGATCDTTTGACSDQAKPDGSECIDGDACTVGDHCVSGACTSGSPRDCNDHLSCTDDVCEEATGCAHETTPTCENCDAVECTACGDACDADYGKCVDGCWTRFFGCLSGCTSTYCAPFCQVDLGRCVAACPAAAICRSGCEAGNACGPGCAPQQ